MSKMLQLKGWALTAVLLLGVGGHAQAARSAKFEGEVVAVSGVTLPAQLTLDNGSAELTVDVTSRTKIVAEDERGSIFDLAAAVGTSAPARVVYDTRTMDARVIKLKDDDSDDEEDAEVVARVLSADPTTGSVQLDTNDDEVVDLTVTADSTTEIELGDTHLTVDQIDLLTGLVARVEYNTTTFVASEIEAEAPRPQEVSGVVTDVNLDEQVLTVDVNGEVREFELAADADIRLRGHRVGVEALQVGDAVTVTYIESGEADVAVRVMVKAVKPRSVNGELVATTDTTLTVAGRQGDVVLNVDANTSLRLNGKTTTLAELQAALDAGKSVRIAAQYYERAGGNLALKVHANARGGGKGKGRGR